MSEIIIFLIGVVAGGAIVYIWHTAISRKAKATRAKVEKRLG